MRSLEMNLYYEGMCFFYKVRDFFSSPLKMLNEAGIKQGCSVLDFGCGPGSYSIAASKLAGEKGSIYSLDIHPLAIRKVKCTAEKQRLGNIETIQTDCKTGLPDGSMDIVLLYNVYHDLHNKMKVLEELHRILKDIGTLSFSDHHIRKEDILSELTKGDFFKLDREHKKTYGFRKI
jgi:ubiquinone/menaquinone biosynthesis C-methylase UbiE